MTFVSDHERDCIDVILAGAHPGIFIGARPRRKAGSGGWVPVDGQSHQLWGMGSAPLPAGFGAESRQPTG